MVFESTLLNRVTLLKNTNEIHHKIEKGHLVENRSLYNISKNQLDAMNIKITTAYL